MYEKLRGVAARYEELTRLLADPEVVSDPTRYTQYAKEHSDLSPVVKSFEQWEKASAELEGSMEILGETEDDEMRQLAQAEIGSLKKEKEKLHQELMLLLLPKDPNDDKNTIVEIRAGTGGDEAALFAGDLFNMLGRYAERNRWKVEVLSSSESSVGGYKEIIARIVGKDVYRRLKYESGVHRVQRVPTTETQGRIHTSTVTAAVLPEAEEVEVDIEEKDLRIDVFRASGPGGQSVNTTDSAVRITHLPSGMVVTCQDEKSQLKNKNRAMTVLRSRLLDAMQREQQSEISENRRSQIGTGERSEKVRTYNFPQGRVTDHRIGLTLYQLDTILSGSLDNLVEPLAAHFRAELLKQTGDED